MRSLNQPRRNVWGALALALVLASPGLVSADNGKQHGKRLSAADRQDILDVISAYSYTYDSKDPVRWLGLFTDNATWSWYAGPDKVLVRDVRGKADLRVFVEGLIAGLRAQSIQSRHYQTNTVFKSFDGKVARTSTMALITWQFAFETAPKTVHSGIYEDEFVKTKDGWKFTKRVLYNDHN